MRCLAVVILLLIAVDAGADPSRHLDDARKHYADLDFELVLTDTDAVAADPRASPAHKTEALFLRGSALIVLDRDADASAAFDALLALDPDYVMSPAAPPRIRASFAGVRAARQIRLEEELGSRQGAQLGVVKLDVVPPATPRGGLPLKLRVQLTDPHHLVSRVVLGYRRSTESAYASLSASSAPVVDLVIPGSVTASDTPYRLDWYVHGVHASGARVRRIGDEGEPRTLAISAGQVPESPGITSRWWFWAGLATLAASAVAVPILIDQSRDVGPQTIVVGGG